MGKLTRDEWITGVAFLCMVSGWIFASPLHINVTIIAFAGLGVLLMTNVLTMDDIAKQGDTLATFLWLAVLFALSGQLNELGFMTWAGQRLANELGGLSWPVTYVALIGRSVVWYNDVEEGFNRSHYTTYGQIDDYWCNQDELEVTIGYLMNALELGADLTTLRKPSKAPR